MTDDRADMMLELLRRIRAEQEKMHSELSDLRQDVQELKIRATAVDEHLSGLFITVSGNNSRLDRVDERLARIERRLELTEAK